MKIPATVRIRGYCTCIDKDRGMLLCIDNMETDVRTAKNIVGKYHQCETTLNSCILDNTPEDHIKATVTVI